MRPMGVKGSTRRGPTPATTVAKAAPPHRARFEDDKELLNKVATGTVNANRSNDRKGKGKSKGKKAKGSGKDLSMIHI